MLNELQRERITETWNATGNITMAVWRVGPKYREAARDFVYSELREELGGEAGAGKAPLFRGVLSPGELIGSQQPLPRRGVVKRYLLTCAQNNTVLNEEVWRNILALRDWYKAELFVGRILYDRGVSRRNQKTWAVDSFADTHDKSISYAPEIGPFVLDSPTELAPGLRWCGELNVLATASQPLSGFEGYAKEGSIIVPHTRIAMKSLPRMGSSPEPRFAYSTGAVTAINYIPRAAGQKAAFAHCYGALLVEVNHHGEWWARQVQADKNGVLCDLNVRVSDGKATVVNDNVESIVWGDVHVEVLDEQVKECVWGEGGVVDTLNPAVQVLHDVLDFRRRNHHDRDKPLDTYKKWVEERESVFEEVRECAHFISRVSARCDSWILVVDSNHDRALTRWLDETDYRDDPANAVFYLEMQLARYKAARDGEPFHALEHACRKWCDTGKIQFLRQDESYRLHNVEHGMHGDRGVDGRRGSPAAYSQMDSKVTVGHSHSASIHAGVYTVGTSSKLRLSYTQGPSTWSHTHCILYANGERALFTIRNGRAWA